MTYDNINLDCPKVTAPSFVVAIDEEHNMVYGFGQVYIETADSQVLVYTETDSGYQWITTADLRKLPQNIRQFVTLNKQLILLHYA